MAVILINNLTKIYKSNFGKKQVIALEDINLNIENGSVFGLLGQNGAGKTTLIKILLGITHATSGNFSLLNSSDNNHKIKKLIGYLPENHKFPNYLTGRETLKYFGKFCGLNGAYLDKKIDEMLQLVNMKKWEGSKIKTYSKGMIQRLGLAQAMINDPELIFLDEPTDGVDPIGRKEIRDILLELRNKGKTIFLNSHLLSEVEMITDRIAILNRGKVIQEGNLNDLTNKQEEYKIVVDKEIENKISDSVFKRFSIQKINSNTYTVKIPSGDNVNFLIDTIRQNEILITEISLQKNTLEDIFINLVKNSEKEVNA